MAPKSSAKKDVPLPSDIVPAVDILDGSKHKPGDFVNVIGIVQKALAPMLTKRSQWKTDLELYDVSTQYDSELRLVYSVFHADENLLSTVKCGDIIALLRVKVQAFGIRFSLLHNFQTSLFIFANQKMPPASADPTPALRNISLQPKHQLTGGQLAYISFLFHAVDKGRLPTDEEFQTIKIQSEHVKDKFSELKDVQDSRFYDLKVNVVKEPFDSGDKMTLWVSDFTENPKFYQHAYDPLANMSTENQDGDEFGYLNKFGSGSGTSGASWPGPYGQRSLQITCWGYHADAIRDHKLGIGSWAHLKNVQIKVGHNGGNLEGYMREDHNAREKIRIQPLDSRADGQSMDPHLKAALRRKRDYEKAKKNDLKGIAEAAHAGQKRKALHGADAQPGSKPLNRKQKRAAQNQKKKEEREAVVQMADESTKLPDEHLNPAVKFEDHDIRPSSVEEILAEKSVDIGDGNEKVTVVVPFVNASYRGNFRVTDFLPDRVEEFAVATKGCDEYAALSDNDDNNSDSDMSGVELSTESPGDRKFEWRFAVKLEDAEVGSDESNRTFWALVDNQAGEYLTNLDAVDLSRDDATLERLRETLFLLWGNLEEKKRQAFDKQDEAAARARDGRPPDSSHITEWDASAKDGVSNLPFGCCILEYGVKVEELNESKADAGLGYRWKRLFRLERTRIVKD